MGLEGRCCSLLGGKGEGGANHFLYSLSHLSGRPPLPTQANRQSHDVPAELPGKLASFRAKSVAAGGAGRKGVLSTTLLPCFLKLFFLSFFFFFRRSRAGIRALTPARTQSLLHAY